MKRYSTSYVGTFAKGDSEIQNIRDAVSVTNKKGNKQVYVKLAGRGTNRVEKMNQYYKEQGYNDRLAFYFAKNNSRSYIPISIATTVDVYIYER
jgi:hypothetical protein